MITTFPALVEASGLEPPTPGLQSRCSPRLSYAPAKHLMLAMGQQKNKGHIVHMHTPPGRVE